MTEAEQGLKTAVRGAWRRVRQLLLNRLALGPAEIGPVLLLAGANFLAMLSYVVVKTVRDSVLLARFDLLHLPYIYMAVAGLLIPLFSLFNHLRRRYALRHLLVGTFCAVAGTLIIWSLLLLQDVPLLPPLFYIWANLYGSLIFALFWLFFHSRTSKRGSRRFVAVAGAGAILGQVVGGAGAGWLAQLLGPQRPEWMLWFAAPLLPGAVLLLLLVDRRWGDPERPFPTSPVRDRDRAKQQRTLSLVFQTPYLRTLTGLIFVSVVIATVVDFIFKTQVQASLSPSSLPIFFGRFYTGVGLAAFLLQFLATPVILQRLGVGYALLLLPLGLLGSSLLCLLQPLFVLFVLQKGIDVGLRASVFRSAQELLYLPVKTAVRRQVKPLIDSVSERAGDATGGLVVLMALHVFGGGRTPFLIVTGVGVLLWLWLGLQARKEYVELFRARMEDDQLLDSIGEFGIQDSQALRALYLTLRRGKPRQVLRALEQFEAFGKADLVPINLLEHTDARVRRKALQLAHKSGNPELGAKVDKLLQDPRSGIRRRGLEVLFDIDPARARGVAYGVASDKDPRVRATAACCLMRTEGHEDPARGRRILEQLRKGSGPDRRALGEALGRFEFHAPVEWFGDLLRDPDRQVRRLAALAAGKTLAPELIEPLCGLLADASTAGIARRVLVRHRDACIPTLMGLFWRRQGDHWLGIEIMRVLGDIGTRGSWSALRAALSVRDGWTRRECLRAMARHPRNFRRDEMLSEQLHEILARDLRRLRCYLAQQCVLGEAGDPSEPYVRLLLDHLEEYAEASLERSFLVLDLLSPGKGIASAFGRYRDEEHGSRATAVAFLEAILDPEHKEQLIPLLEDLPLAQRLQRARVTMISDVAAALRQLIRNEDPWLAAVAVAAARFYREGASVVKGIAVDGNSARVLREAVARAGADEASNLPHQETIIERMLAIRKSSAGSKMSVHELGRQARGIRNGR